MKRAVTKAAGAYRSQNVPLDLERLEHPVCQIPLHDEIMGATPTNFWNQANECTTCKPDIRYMRRKTRAAADMLLSHSSTLSVAR